MSAQQERALATRERILDATMSAVRERGIPGTTTVEVCERAGLARGTLLHHFPTRETLIAAALERGADDAIRSLHESLAQAPEDADRIEVGVRALWAMADGPGFAIWLELVVAARADPKLREVVQELSDRFQSVGEEVLGLSAETTQLALGVINGFMIDRMLGLNGERIEDALARLPAALRAA